jgi:hypothetical protein
MENRLKRVAEDTEYSDSKRVRHSESVQKGTKRRMEEEEEEMVEPAKKSRVIPYSKGVKRSCDTVDTHPTKRVKTTHWSLLRGLDGCRFFTYMDDDHDEDGGSHAAFIPIVA